MSTEVIQFKKADGVATITLNRPEARNSLTPEMVRDLASAIRSCGARDVRAVLLTGAGDAFCAGADVKVFADELENNGPEGLSRHLHQMAGVLHRDVVMPLCKLEKPVVAAINGVAAGGGFSLTLACDIRIAAKSARFLMAYANIGMPADGGSTFLLPRLVGSGKAMELYLASQPMSAEAALEIGLISQVCEKEQLDQHALETAVRLAHGATKAIGRAKTLFQQSWDSTLEAQLEAETQGMTDLSLTRDAQEGIRAFTQKRQARFQGE